MCPTVVQSHSTSSLPNGELESGPPIPNSTFVCMSLCVHVCEHVCTYVCVFAYCT